MTTTGALVTDGFLVAGFGVQHSILATVSAKARARRRFGIEALPWRSVESLSNVVYILIAAALWQQVSGSAWDVTGPAGVVLWTVLAASWLWYWQLHLFEYDCGLAFGSTTLVERVAGRSGAKLVPWKVGSRRWIRFPVHTAFFGMFFAIPHMTYDVLVLAIVLNVYNVIGSVLYDRRLEKSVGAPYRAYQQVTGLIWPPIYRAPRGAAEIKMPEPRHWHRPAMHLPGLAMGLVLGALYFVVLGNGHVGVLASIKAAGVGVLGAICVGIVLGRICRPEADSWDQQQTDLSTTVALGSAVGVALWAGATWVVHDVPPAFAVFLPLWFTVQYLGHVFAFMADRRKWSGMAEDLAVDDATRSLLIGTQASRAGQGAETVAAISGETR